MSYLGLWYPLKCRQMFILLIKYHEMCWLCSCSEPLGIFHSHWHMNSCWNFALLYTYQSYCFPTVKSDVKRHQLRVAVFPGPSCSKLTMSLVNDSLKFTSSDTQIYWNFLLKKCKLLTFFQQKISEYCILNPLKQLTKWPLTSSLS